MGAKQWIECVNKELANPPHTSEESAAHWSKQSIYRIPASVTAINSTAYSPYIVSIGPYHHGSGNTKPMEKHKRRALLRFLDRSNQPLQAYWDALAPVAQDLKDAYDELSPERHDTDEFLQLMIVDGCFILEILRATTIPFSDAPPLPSQHQGDHPSIVRDYAVNDPVFSRHGMLYVVPYLRRDMLMLENQLPMLVLQKLAAVQKDESLKDYTHLTKRIMKFFHQYISTKQLPEFNHCRHILDIYRKSLVHEEPRRHKAVRSGAGHIYNHNDEVIHCATELVEGGITIKRSKTTSLKDISFNNENCLLRLPLIVVDESMESLYLNQMAFERVHVGAGNEVTSFVFFMKNVISSSSDVAILQNCGVIQNSIGSEDEVVKLFHSLSKDVTLDPESSLDVVHRRVSAYCRKPWSMWRADIVHTYFTDPWAITAAAILLFVLTLLQTIFSILAYANPP